MHGAWRELGLVNVLQAMTRRGVKGRIRTESRLSLWALLCGAPARLLLAFAALALLQTSPERLSAQHQMPSAPPPSFKQAAADAVFDHLNESNGLASPIVTSFAEDGDGFLWIASQSGIQRWDGYRFWTYKTVLGDATSIPDNLVSVLYTDSQGRLWAGTSSGGLARYDRMQDRFIRYRTEASSTQRVNVTAITGDGALGIWLVSDTGLDHLDTVNGTFTHAELVPIDGQQIKAEQVATVLRSPDGALWVGTALGLERSAPGVGPHRVFQEVPLPFAKGISSEINSIFCDRNGRIWVGTRHGPFVLNGSSGPSGKLVDADARKVLAKGPNGESLAKRSILSISQTSQGEIWFGTPDQGILTLDPATWEVQRMSQNAAVPTSLSNNWVTTLYPGRSGIMWIGTQRGASYIDTTPRAAYSILGGAGDTPTITDTDVLSMLTRRDGSIWLGLNSKGVDLLDPTGHLIGEMLPGAASSNAGLLPGTIQCIYEAEDRSVYICTQQGLYHTLGDQTRSTDRGSKAAVPKVEQLPIGAEPSDGLTQVTQDQGLLLIGGNHGVWEFDPKDKKGPAKQAHLNQPLTDPRVNVFLRGSGDTLWVGTSNGLNRVDLKTRDVEAILPDPANPTALGGGMISSLLIDRKGRLWVGTFSGGIDVFEGRDAQGRARFHRIIDDLPNENVDKLLEAHDGNIWASTDGGLAMIDPDTFKVVVLRRAEGALLAAYWNNVGAVTAAGELIFGGTGGLTVVRPDLVKPWEYQPPIVVTHARIGSVDVPLARFNSGVKEYPVWISPDHNDLTVEFSSLDYTAPERNRYEYKLVGFDHDWVAADATRRVARYTNLPPGHYTLLLRGSNRDGLWAPAREIRILVIPAWYQTIWFRFLAVLGGILGLIGLFMLGRGYQRRQQRELERQVALRTSELHQMTVELKDSQQRLEHMAYRDSLTGLPNRRMFTEHFRRLLAIKRREEGFFSLLLIDLDDFKEINDTYGHDAGDAVLQEIAVRVTTVVRESDCFARLGGDEFGLLLADSPDIDGLETICNKIVEMFDEPILFGGIGLKTALSIGVALFPEGGDTQDTLYKAADLALYQAKRQGGSGWSLQGAELKRL